jgi:pimeloyl-ACP methyl ester carboxylesterase
VTLRHEQRLINGIRLHYVIAGAGPLLLLLHGFPEFWYSWRHQIPLLAQHYTVVALDLRGYNESEKPRRVKDYRLSILIDDITGLIESLGEKQAIVAGHDWGGAVAWGVAIARPETIQKLIILNMPHPRLLVQHLLTNPRQRARSWYVFFFQLPLLPELALRANNFQAVQAMFLRTSINPATFDQEVLRQYRNALAKPGALTAALNYYRAAGRYGLLSQIDSASVVQHPTLVIWGKQDVALGAELNDGLERYVPNLTLRYVPNASHWVQQEHPALVSRYMLEFLTPAA